MTNSLAEKLLKRKQAGNLRQLVVSEQLIDFASNDYLGLARSRRLTEAMAQELKFSPVPLNRWGSTGSRLLTGNSHDIQELETKIAAFHGFEAGLLFNCGYMANLGLLSTIGQADDCIFFDACVHASTRDGLRLSQAKAFPFRHNDLNHLESRLKKCTTIGDRFICIESIYSTDGSFAPLAKICTLAKQYHAYLIVDEAHAVGLYGPQGRGLLAEHDLCAAVFAQIVTFGKALGVQGAAVLGSHLLKQTLINFATSYIYTTALPWQAVAAINCSYTLFPTMENERAQLQRLISHYRKQITYASSSHIQAVPMAGNSAAKKLAQDIARAGLDVRAFLSPSVQRGQEILRLCLHTFNTEYELQRLLDLIKRNIK